MDDNVEVDTNKTFLEKKWVWIADAQDTYVPGNIIKEEKGKYRVKVSSGDEIVVDEDRVFKMNPPKFDLVEDLASLSHLNEASVLSTLKKRYECKEIYTYSGLFLVAINPYQNLRIYGSKIIKSYNMNKKQNLKPHIYAVANEAYNNMLLMRENQSVLITGESGAGKTENTKKAINFLASVAGQKGKNPIENQIIEANVILEAFGNAMTIRNDNSSRFGKFVQIGFVSGVIVGAHIEKYLLEKSRVTTINKNERSYHIFYSLLQGADKALKEELFLGDVHDYAYLRSRTAKIQGIDDAQEFKTLNASFDLLEISEAERKNFFKIVSVVLHLGNIDFEVENNQVSILNIAEVEIVCQLLEISTSGFLKCLLHPQVKAGNESFVNVRSKEQCVVIVEALAKILYDRMFDSVTEKINRCLSKSSRVDNFIGLLDIAGFEIFKENSFEQLCINYTNEKLQQFFNHHMFILEQELYRRENIEWDFIDFGLDLQPTIDLIEKNNPIGILSFLDEQCLMPAATDKTLVQKIAEIKNEKLCFNRLTDGFVVNHYAGKVEYHVENWLIKNKDPFFENLADLLHLSSNAYISSLVSLSSEVKQRGFFRTVSQVHKSQLKSLMDRLRLTKPHFVRCIIPNNVRSPKFLDNHLVLNQLRCNGVLEGIRISRLGYPSRMLFVEFKRRYQVLLGHNKQDGDSERHDAGAATKVILEHMKIHQTNYKIGKTMVFFKQEVLADVEDLRELRIGKIAREVQSLIRKNLFQRRFDLKNLRIKAINLIQYNASLSIAFQKWSWWRLYMKLKPLMKVAQMDELIKSKEIAISTLDSKLKESEERNKVLHSEIASVSANSENMARALQNERNILLEKDEYIASLMTKNVALNDAVKIRETELEGFKVEQAALTSTIESFRVSLGAAEASARAFSERVCVVEKELHEQRKQLEGLRCENVLQEKELIQLRTELETNKIKSKTKTETLLQQKDREIAALKFIAEEKVKLEDNLRLSERLLADKAQEAERLHKEKGYLDTEVERLRRASADMEERAGSKDVENEGLLAKIAEMQESAERKIAGLNSTIKKLREENGDSLIEIERLNTLEEAHAKENVELKRDIAGRANEISLLKSENIKNGLNLQNQRTQIGLLNDEVKRLQADDVERNTTTDILLSKIRANEARIRKLDEALKEELSANKQLVSEKEILEKENQNLMQSKIEDLFKREEEFTCEKKNLQLRINKLETECQRLNVLLSERSVHEPSEESSSNYEKLLLLLEDERKANFEMKRLLVAEENKHLVILNEKESLAMEIESLRTVQSKPAVDTSRVEDLKKEIREIRTHVNQVMKGINQTYFTILESYRTQMADYELLKQENADIKSVLNSNTHVEERHPKTDDTWLLTLVNEREMEIALLTKKLEVLAENLRESDTIAEKELLSSKKTVNELNIKIGTLEESLKQKAVSEYNAERLIKGMQRDIDYLKNELADKESAVTKLDARLSELFVEIKDSEKKAMNDMRLRNETLLMKSSQEMLKERAHKAESTMAELKQYNQKLIAELVEIKKTDFKCDHSFYESKISAASGQMTVLEDRTCGLIAELGALRKQYNEQSLKMAQVQRVSDENAKFVEFFKPFTLLKKN